MRNFSYTFSKEENINNDDLSRSRTQIIEKLIKKNYREMERVIFRSSSKITENFKMSLLSSIVTSKAGLFSEVGPLPVPARCLTVVLVMLHLNVIRVHRPEVIGSDMQREHRPVGTRSECSTLSSRGSLPIITNRGWKIQSCQILNRTCHNILMDFISLKLNSRKTNAKPKSFP